MLRFKKISIDSTYSIFIFKFFSKQTKSGRDSHRVPLKIPKVLNPDNS